MAISLDLIEVEMSNRRPLPWSKVLAELKSDRLQRAEIREERLRAASGLRGAPALALSAWRGISGRRYVVSVQQIAGFDPAEMIGTVALFVTRDATGVAAIVFGSRDITADGAPALLASATDDGATEVHLHRISEPREHAFVMADLGAHVLEVA